MEPYDIHKKTADPPGPPIHIPHFRRSDECAVGVALLPGRVHTVVMDRSGRVREGRARIIVNNSDAILATIDALCSEMAESVRSYGDIKGIGLSLDGKVIDGRRCTVEELGWLDFPLLDSISGQGGLPLSLINSLEGLATYEAVYGVGQRLDNFLIVQIAENVCYVEVKNGAICPDPAGNYRRSAHLRLEGSNAVCAQGHYGCVSGSLVPSAVIGQARAARISAGDTDRPRDIEELIRMAQGGDQACRKAILGFVRNLAMCLEQLSEMTKIDHIVLDGSAVRILSSEWAVLFEDELFTVGSPGEVLPVVTRRASEDSRWACGAAAYFFESGDRGRRKVPGGDLSGSYVPLIAV